LALLLVLGALAAGALAHAGAPAPEQNWPQWRGPLCTGVAPEGNPPTEWSESKNVKWKVKIPGSGSASPIVWGDRVYVQTAVPTAKQTAAADRKPDEPPTGGGKPGGKPGGRGGRGGMSTPKPTDPYQFVVLCLDRETGKTVWQKTARQETPHEGHHPSHGFASHSPVTDGTVIVAYFGSRGLYCYDMQGNLKWEKELGKMRTRAGFGEGSSPALSGNTVVVNWDHEGEDFIVAFDKETGRERWRQPRDESTTWSTPLVVEHNGKAQVITTATNKVRSYDLETGKQVWECEGLTANAIPSPVWDGKDTIYATSGYRGSKLLAIRLGRDGDLTGTDAILWRHEKNTPYVPSPLLYGHRLYFYSSNESVLSCFDTKSGKALFGPERVTGLRSIYASPVGAAGRVYLVDREGTTVVIKDADKLEILATNRLDDPIDASPAVVGKELFLRGSEHLYCIAEK
jgi:outer membrane protein assembly factor BamB